MDGSWDGRKDEGREGSVVPVVTSPLGEICSFHVWGSAKGATLSLRSENNPPGITPHPEAFRPERPPTIDRARESSGRSGGCFVGSASSPLPSAPNRCRPCPHVNTFCPAVRLPRAMGSVKVLKSQQERPSDAEITAFVQGSAKPSGVFGNLF